MIIKRLLSNPKIFNLLRALAAGKQTRTKNFVKEVLDKYGCQTVLDLCCGTGEFCEIISSYQQYVGIDDNKIFIDFAKKKYQKEKNKKFLIANVINSSFPPLRLFDGVMLISALHHFSDQELKILLPRIMRLTKKVAIFADIISNPPGLLRKIAVCFDQGRYVRNEEDKIAIIKPYFDIKETKLISSRLAIQFGIVGVPKIYKISYE